MNRENVKLWTDALRSGQYKQGIGGLRREVNGEQEYCCLGVACEVAISNGVDLQVRDLGPGYYFEYADESGHLPPQVQAWLGIDVSNPCVAYPTLTRGSLTPLAVLNDDYNMPFDQIADLIDESLTDVVP